MDPVSPVPRQGAKPLTCQAARPLEGGGGIQFLRMLAVLFGRVDQALGGRQGGVGADGGAQLVDGRRGDGGLHGGGRGHADWGQAGRGHDDVDGRAGAVGLGQAAGRLLGRGAARSGVGGTLRGRASALQLGGRAALRGGQRGAPARRRGQRGAGVVKRRGGGRRVGQVEGAAQAGREGLPRRRRRWRRLGARQVPRATGRALCRESRERARSEVGEAAARRPAPPGCRGQLLHPDYARGKGREPTPQHVPSPVPFQGERSRKERAIRGRLTKRREACLSSEFQEVLVTKEKFKGHPTGDLPERPLYLLALMELQALNASIIPGDTLSATPKLTDLHT